MVGKVFVKNKGFSLVELIIVIAIMAILSAALAPAIIRYIDKSRKGIDLECAKTIYDAACTAMANSNEDIANGWDEVLKYNDGKFDVTDEDGETYTIRPVAWCRGIQKGAKWENTFFKPAHNQSTYEVSYVDDFLIVLGQELAHGNKNYNGYYDDMLKMRYKKDSGKGKPECWILYRREDNGYPEVWIGYKSGVVRPAYRMYPNTCPEYR